jgi:hypothetical protein
LFGEHQWIMERNVQNAGAKSDAGGVSSNEAQRPERVEHALERWWHFAVRGGRVGRPWIRWVEQALQDPEVGVTQRLRPLRHLH